MLLLNLPSDNILTITLDNLFHISTGILEDKHERFIELDGELQKVWFLHMGDMRSEDGLIDFENLEYNESRLLASRLRREQFLASNKRKVEKNTTELLPLTSKKLIQSTDYLLCIRGVPTGYSVMRSLKNLPSSPVFQNFTAAATHHFVIFRLRDNYAHMDVQLIHLLLDTIVKIDLLDLYNKKRQAIEDRKRNNDEPSMTPVVITSIREIKDIIIKIPKQIESHGKLIEMHNELIKQAKELREKTERYLEEIKKLTESKS